MSDKNFSLAGMSESSPHVKKFKDALEKGSGQKVTFTTIAKIKKTSGEISKDLEFGLENGQKVTFVIRRDGDAFRVKLNDKDLPISGDLDPNYKPTFSEAMKEIAASVRGNQAKFNKSLTMQRVKIPPSPGTKAVSVVGEIKQTTQLISSINTRITEKTVIRDDLKTKLDQISQTQAV